MHETGGVGRNDVLGSCTGVIAYLVVTHLRGYDFLEDGERAAEAAAFVGPRRGGKLDPRNLRKQIQRLGEEWLMQLGRPRMLEPAQRAAAVMQPDAMRKSRPGEGVDFQDVVQELDDLVRALANLGHLRGLLDGIKIIAHVVNAATRGRDDIVESGEIAHEQRFGGGALVVEAAIGHRLAATGLIARIDHLEPEALEQLECRNADRWKEGIDVAGNKQTDTHVSSLRKIFKHMPRDRRVVDLDQNQSRDERLCIAVRSQLTAAGPVLSR